MISDDIYPVFDKALGQQDKEMLLGQKGLVVWMTGLSGAGKSTIAIALERALHERGVMTCLLDGDNIRTGINAGLGFSDQDRTENIRRIAQVGKLFLQNGIVTVVACISPTKALRSMAREIVGGDRFFEIYVSTPLEVCEKRDVKGLYQKAREGKLQSFTGISSAYEVPDAPQMEIDTSKVSVQDAVSEILSAITPLIANE